MRKWGQIFILDKRCFSQERLTLSDYLRWQNPGAHPYVPYFDKRMEVFIDPLDEESLLRFKRWLEKEIRSVVEQAAELKSASIDKLINYCNYQE